MAFVIVMILLGFLAGIGLKSVWYPTLALLLCGPALLFGVAVSGVGTSGESVAALIGAFLMLLVIGGLHLVYRRSAEKLAPSRSMEAKALEARRKSHADAGLTSKIEDAANYAAWKEATANEWWRKYPDFNGNIN